MDRVRYLIGIITLLLAVAGGVYLVNLLDDDDQSLYFRLHVELRNVEGLLPGADVKYRGVQVGSVRRVTLRDDGKKGIAVIALNPGKEELACTNSKFWIVTPRFGGLASGASGLETLVRDAYVAFLTPDPRGPELTNGSSVAGWEVPFVDPSDTGLLPPRRGDLLMTLLVPENHGLVPGSEVRFRGVRTGEVRGVELAKDGSHIRLRLRIDRQYRSSVTDRTAFWVARPRLSGGLVGGMSLDDLSALLSAFVSYHSDPGQGTPVADGYLVAAEPHRPEIAFEKVSTEGIENGDRGLPTERVEQSAQLVRVIYEATEDDWWSADDQVRREGTGVLFEDNEGQLLVLTGRSLCDASYFVRDTFGTLPDILSETITVVLRDGTVVRARRTWAAPEEADMALLTLDELDARQGVAVTSGEVFAFDWEGSGALTLTSLDSERQPSESAVAADRSGMPALALHRGATAVQAGKIVGLLGQEGSGTGGSAVIVPLNAIPESLRPRP